MKDSTENIDMLVCALREELQQYGEMLVLLDRQQEQVKSRSADQLFESISVIQAQATAIQIARGERERCASTVARDYLQPDGRSLGQVIPHLPADYRPLLQALVDENNQLLVRVRQRARQNHVMLRRSVDLMQELLRTVFPARQTSVYGGNGQRRAPVLVAAPLYSAVG